MVKRAAPTRVNVPNGRSFVARYKRVLKERLPPNITMRRRYKQNPTPKNKRRRQDGRCLFSFIEKGVKNRAVKALARAALKRAPALLDNLSKRTKNKTLKKVF